MKVIKMNIKKFESFAIVTSLASFLLLTGCSRNISNDVYHDRTVGETAHTLRGRVVSVRNVTVGPEQLDENTSGAAIGGVLGGVGGSMLGGGRGHILGAGVGAVGGAVAGSLIEKELRTQQGLEYIVELMNGELRTIVQGAQPAYPVGSKVLLMITHKGRSRIVADTTVMIR